MHLVHYLARSRAKPSYRFARYLALLERLVDLRRQAALAKKDGQNLDFIPHKVRKRTLGHDGLIVIS